MAHLNQNTTDIKTKILKILFCSSTFLVFFFSSLDSFFYLGFTQKHFSINLQQFIFFYLIFTALLSLFKIHPFSKKILKLNRILLPIIILAQTILILVEKSHYPNFVFSHFHLNFLILFYLPLISLSVFIFHDFKWTKTKTLFIVIPLVSIYLSQYISFGRFFDFKLLEFNSLIYNLPNFKTIVINYILWLSLLLFFIGIFKKKYQSFIGYLIFFFLFSLTNRYKSNMLGAPFVINDLRLIWELGNLIPTILQGTSLKKELILGIIGVIFLFYFLKKKFNQDNPPIKNKIFLLIIPVLIFSFPIFFPLQFQQGTKKIKIENYIPNPIDSCYVNGNLFCFYNDLKNLRTPPPPDYSQEKINQIYSQLPTQNLKDSKKEQPNIIVILSEAFWDPTLLPQVTYVPDPIPNIRKDIKSTFISPSFGGGTANVEFELLTGFSNYFLSGISPYSQAIRKPLPSLFTLFKNQGYLTTTIHPFRASFYNRKSVYKNFGLDNFISSGNMKNPEYAGPFISDAYFDQQIVDQLNSTDQPQFIFGLSMQNHVVFSPNRYSDHPVKIKSNLSQNDQDILQSYVDGLHLTDLDYIQLKEKLGKIKKPTILLLFGDHLTSLGDGSDIYQKAGFDTSNETKMHSTLIATWSNFNQTFDLPPQISPNFLSLEVLKLANIQPKYQFSFLSSLEDNDTVLNKSLPTKINPEQLNNYKLIQYDLIYGKQYSLK